MADEQKAMSEATKPEKKVLTAAELAEKKAKQEQRRADKLAMNAKREKILSYDNKEDWDNGIIALGMKNITLEIIEEYSRRFAGSEAAHKDFMALLVENSYRKTIVEKNGKQKETVVLIPSMARKEFFKQYFPALANQEKATKSRSRKLYDTYKRAAKEE